MPFPGPRPVKAVCEQCHYSCVTCMEGDVFFAPTCARCGGSMDMSPLDNPLLEILLKRLPPFLRRQLNGRVLVKKTWNKQGH